MNTQLALQFPLDDGYTLGDYVGDVTGRLESARGIAVVTGGAGSGKSHLLQGLCQAGRASGTAIYIPSLHDHAPAILDGLERFEVICLDDIDRVLGDKTLDNKALDNRAWEEALFHLVNICLHQDLKLVMASSEPVGALNIVLPDLASRLKAAYLFPVRLPDDAGKLEIIRRKARRRGFEMSEDVCRFILSRAPRDMHHIAYLVERLDAETLRRQKKVTIPFVKEALGL